MARATAAEAAETGRRILAAATAQFAEHGYAEASVDDIATISGVTRGAVYHHYSSKPKLFAAVAEAQQQALSETIAQATVDAADDNALRLGSHAYLDAITQGAAVRVLLIDGPAVLSWEEWRRLDADGPVARLREGLALTGIDAEILEPLTAGLSGAMNEIALWLAEQTSDATASVRAHQALDRLLDSI